MKLKKLQAVRFLAAAIALAAGSQFAHAGDVVVAIDNIKTGSGTIIAGMFDNAKDFNKTPRLQQTIAAQVGTITLTFKNLPPGRYAVAVFHDLNGNQKLDTNFVGKPVEPYGFSRDPKSLFGPPAFDDAAFQVDQGAKTVNVSLR